MLQSLAVTVLIDAELGPLLPVGPLRVDLSFDVARGLPFPAF